MQIKLSSYTDTSRDRRRGSTNLKQYLASDPALDARYTKLRRNSANIRGSSYDISKTCNLTCEGCLFFEGEDFDINRKAASASGWAELFRREIKRGINFPFLAGAEPALARDVLDAAGAVFTRGVLFTNGTIAISKSLPFTIHVSLWGTPEESEVLRGGSHFHKSLRNFSGDPRARFILTINRLNLMSARQVAQICSDEGVKLSFNLFSPTTGYTKKLNDGQAHDENYFRFSTAEKNLSLTANDLQATDDFLPSIAEDFPKTVIYTKAYSQFVTNPLGLYTIDPETGWATDCETRKVGYHHHYRTDLSHEGAKCCSPNLDCSGCRSYAMATGTAVNRFPRYLNSIDAFRDWVDIAEQWTKLFLIESDGQQ